MIKRYLFFGLLLIFGCNSKQNSQVEYVKDSVSSVAPREKENALDDIRDVNALDDAKVENVNDTSFVYIITKPGAVNFEPDTARMGEEKKKMSDEDWSTVIDDWMFYNSEATQALEKSGIDIVVPGNNRRYLKFKKTRGEDYVIDKKKIEGFYVFILFNGIDDPV